MKPLALCVLAACSYSPDRLAPGQLDDAPPADPDAPVVIPDAPVDAPPILPACATDPLYVPSPAGVRYFVSLVPLAWSAAQAECATKGAHLAIIKSQAENQYLDGLSNSVLWIGMNDLVTEGVFVWLDGTVVDSGFTSWRSMQPNNDSGNQHCGELDPFNPTWNDFVCEVPQQFVCECPP